MTNPSEARSCAAPPSSARRSRGRCRFRAHRLRGCVRAFPMACAIAKFLLAAPCHRLQKGPACSGCPASPTVRRAHHDLAVRVRICRSARRAMSGTSSGATRTETAGPTASRLYFGSGGAVGMVREVQCGNDAEGRSAAQAFRPSRKQTELSNASCFQRAPLPGSGSTFNLGFGAVSGHGCHRDEPSTGDAAGGPETDRCIRWVP